MAFQECTRIRQVEDFVHQGYEQMPGKTLVIWPPMSCVKRENRVSTYRRLKEEFGICVLHIYMSSTVYEDALKAGWDNDQLRLAFDPKFMDAFVIEDWQRNSSFPVPNWERYTGPMPPTILDLVQAGLLDYATAVEYTFRILQSTWADIRESIMPGAPVKPFYSFYTDEPQTNAYAIGWTPRFTRTELEKISNYIRKSRSSGNPHYVDDDGRKTLFNLSAFYGEWPINAGLWPRLYSGYADVLFYSSYKNTGFDWVTGGFGLWGDPRWDQAEEWTSFDADIPNASGYISLQADWNNNEFLDLLETAGNLKWDTLAIFGGDVSMPCDEFWRRLNSFCIMADARNWMKMKGYYRTNPVMEYCNKPNCADCTEADWSSSSQAEDIFNQRVYGDYGMAKKEDPWTR